MERSKAEIVREYGPFGEGEPVHGVSYDGHDIWFASGDQLRAVDPKSGASKRTIATRGTAGTAFDGKHLFQIADGKIQEIDPVAGKVLGAFDLPEPGCAGLTWAEGSLWVGVHREKKIHRIDPKTGAILSTIPTTRFVTGVTFADGELWYGTWENERCDLNHADTKTGEVFETIDYPEDKRISGLEFDGKDTFFCGGGPTGKIRAVKKPRKAAAR